MYKMLLTSLLISTIFTILINCNDVNAATTAVLTRPSSRAYNCFVKINYGCDVFKSNINVGTIIGSADFIKDGPKDGELASAGNSLYDVLDEHRSGRWSQSYLKIKEHNATHFVTDIAWIFSNKTVVVDKVQVFLSNGNYTEDQPIQRSSLNLACSYQINDHLIVENYVLRFNCYISSEFIEDLFYLSKGSGILLSTLKIAGTNYAFYQVADVSIHETVNQIANYHGFVSQPPSRAALCQSRVNKNCGRIIYEPQSVEAFKGFPYKEYSPPDGKIASGNKKEFSELDEYGADRWTRVNFPDVNCYNQTHVSFDIIWYLTMPHRTDDIQIYVSNENYTSMEPLSRRHLDLDPLCTVQYHGVFPPRQLTISCPISLEKYRRLNKLKELLLLSIWNIYDTAFGFYQVVDIKELSKEQSYENILRKCQLIN